jgi:hypothetical protein
MYYNNINITAIIIINIIMLIYSSHYNPHYNKYYLIMLKHN